MWTFLALRQLRARARQTGMLVASVAVGVAMLVTALSLVNGFEADLVGRILGATPHVALEGPLGDGVSPDAQLERTLEDWPAVEAVLPYVSVQGLVVRGETARGALLRGVDLGRQRRVASWARGLKVQRKPRHPDRVQVLLGIELARHLGVSPGDRVRVVTGRGRTLDAEVAGLYEAGMYDFDAHVAYLELPALQRVAGMGGRLTGYELKLRDPFMARSVAADVMATLRVPARSWTTSNRALLAALTLEKWVVFLVILAIVVVATMGVANTLGMWVLEQQRDLGLLRSVGATGRGVACLVVRQGLFVAVLGIGAGQAAGLALCSLLARFPLQLPADVYLIEHLPVAVQVSDLVLVTISALAVSWLACLLPARRAARLDPIEVLRRA